MDNLLSFTNIRGITGLKSGLKGILVIALIFTVSTFNRNYVKAETVDDLRDILGYHRANSKETLEEIEKIQDLKKRAELDANMAEYIKELNNEKELKRQEAKIKLENEKEQKEQELLLKISSDASVNEVLQVVRDIEVINEEIKSSYKVNSIIEIEVKNTEDLDELYNYSQMILESIENDLEIGDIGRGLKPPTSGVFIVADAFGEYKDKNTGENVVSNTAIELKGLVYEDTTIISQWNGTIESINKGKIVIRHGPALKTIYNKVRDIKVKEGTKVKQYDKLGMLDGESLHFSIELDGKYIDPLMVYGVEGIEKYFDWVNANPSRIITLNDMSNIKNKADEPSDETEEKVIEAKDEEQDGTIKATLPDDYETPNPGILQ